MLQLRSRTAAHNCGCPQCRGQLHEIASCGDGLTCPTVRHPAHRPPTQAEAFEEKVRIEGNGGRVETRIYDDGYVGPARVYLQFAQVPGLAMSRSLCDTVAKEAGVISEPEITEFKLEQDIKVMILASDGLWEFMSSQEVMDIVSKRMTEGTAPHEVRVNTIDVAAGPWRWRCCGGAVAVLVVVLWWCCDGALSGCRWEMRGCMPWCVCVCACGM